MCSAFVFFLTFTLFMSATQNIIYIIPDNKDLLNDVLFEKSAPWADIREHLFEKKGYVLKTPSAYEKGERGLYGLDMHNQDTIKYIIDLSPNNVFAQTYGDQFYQKIIIFLWEPPTVMPKLYDVNFHKKLVKIFTWDDDLVDNKKFIKIYYPVFHYWNFDPMLLRAFEQKKLCVLINSNKKSFHSKELYSERKKVIEFFELVPEDVFDLYGYKWPTSYKNYRGTVKCPRECLANYRFCICYENMRDVKGYITEKIFNCFAVGCVPIYWGASNVTDYIPEGCFIDRRKFSSTKDLYEYIKNMPQEEYDCYLYNILEFMNSQKALLFTSKNLWKCVEDSLLN